MLWVTSRRIHLDRVASPWLIRRFVDCGATFEFVDADTAVPADATPFALSGAKLGPHDDQGSTFRKILNAYEISAPELQQMATVIEAGIAFAQGKSYPGLDENLLHLAVSLASFSEAMTILRPDDHENLRDSVIYYDSLYQTLWAGYGPAPAVPSDNLVSRILTYRQATDWAEILPRWDVAGQSRAPRPLPSSQRYRTARAQQQKGSL
ncbi:chromate resistance protein [Mycolicibacterium mageritense DSM 44476 = CIP 104973]|uniref:ChrB C-terminal domain-containing protein n=1 Tax=Mycolicibacterium mageritense TaxID=53462 RepID=A0ABM7HP96_MYCME|nr:chromate resistance protein ChrB domain-containing protein [Mycolicibacterium mageritense]MCC9180611.1 chromate resistance protein [Mycolicibacterium mageritense]BBX32361.1 hypothetical protein MMAGJ_16430 [Mycolicibacterium mageritense]GJJ20684.1 hypothetical protein MTY414_43570 [Mycolicibacterium mageritense]CDO23096.1 hypothetical protein BN978_03575 [Mycolicibacterium mageritense DSM 44476 = CIP 104973]